MFIELTQRNGKVFLQNMDKVFSIGTEEGALSDEGQLTILHLRDDSSEFLTVKETLDEIQGKICLQKAIDAAVFKDHINIINQYQSKKEQS